MQNRGLPQAGIITSLDRAAGLAKVFLPIFKIETDWIPVATNLLYEEQIEATNIKATQLERNSHTVYEDAEKTTVKASASGPVATAGTESIQRQDIKKMTWGTLQVGDEVVVVFLNGDVNQGRVIARF